MTNTKKGRKIEKVQEFKLGNLKVENLEADN